MPITGKRKGWNIQMPSSKLQRSTKKAQKWFKYPEVKDDSRQYLEVAHKNKQSFFSRKSLGRAWNSLERLGKGWEIGEFSTPRWSRLSKTPTLGGHGLIEV
jgi:hypothetical protein